MVCTWATMFSVGTSCLVRSLRSSVGKPSFGDSGDLDGDGVDNSEFQAELDFGARIALRGGYALGRNLIYGTLGAAYLDLSIDGEGGIDDVLDGGGEWGYAAGFGYERLVGDNFSIGAQYHVACG